LLPWNDENWPHHSVTYSHDFFKFVKNIKFAMAFKAEQIENGALKKMVSQKLRKLLKKAKHKKLRNTKSGEVPDNNHYEGWAI
jgi:hypothetical protein